MYGNLSGAMPIFSEGRKLDRRNQRGEREEGSPDCICPNQTAAASQRVPGVAWIKGVEQRHDEEIVRTAEMMMSLVGLRR